MKERPEIVNDDHLNYLDDLRESGVTNMFGAGAYVKEHFNVSMADANKIVGWWMQTFESRQEETT